MSITALDVYHVAELAGLDLSPQELPLLQRHLQDSLACADKLPPCDTYDPTCDTLSLESLRPDLPGNCLPVGLELGSLKLGQPLRVPSPFPVVEK